MGRRYKAAEAKLDPANFDMRAQYVVAAWQKKWRNRTRDEWRAYLEFEKRRAAYVKAKEQLVLCRA